MIGGIAERILERALPPGRSNDAIRGDLIQERDRIAARRGDRSAAAWYLRQAISVWMFARRDRARGRGWGAGERLSDVAGGSGLAGELKDAVRGLRRAPGYSAAVVATLGIALAATVSVFTVVRGVLLRDLPYPAPHELVRFDAVDDGEPGDGGMDYPTVRDWQERLTLVPSIAAYQGSSGIFVAENVAEVWEGVAATRDFLRIVGLPPASGDYYRAGGGEIGDMSIYLSHDLWERRFGAAPDIVGTAVDFDDATWTVQGVLPRGFAFPGVEADYVMPLRASDWLDGRGSGFLRVVGRLAPSTSLDAASEQLGALTAALEAEHPTEIREVVLRSVARVETEPVRRMLWVFLGAVSFFLLVACANVSGLALARTESRRQELSIRLSLGANRARIARQLVGESVFLATVGGLVGTVGAVWGVRALMALAPADLPRRDGVAIDPWVLGFALLTAVAAGIAFGSLPGLRGAKIAVLRPRSTRSLSAGARRSQRTLAGAQVALAVVLLSGAALLLRSFAALNSVDPGFSSPDRVLMVELGLGREEYDTSEKILGFHDRLITGLEEFGPVSAAGLSTHLPFSQSRIEASVVTEGQRYRRGEVPLMGLEMVNGSYRAAMGLPLLRGRDPEPPAGRTGTVREVLMNEAGAQLLWPGQDPLGKRFSFDVEEGELAPEESYYTVVGIVTDVADKALDEQVRPRAYYPLSDFLAQYSFISGRFFYLVVRTEADPRGLIDQVARVVRDVDPNMPLRTVETLESMVRVTTLSARFRTVTLGIFALLAVIVALLGVYGVMAYSVAMSVRDIGVRMALGARALAVRREVLTQAFAVVAVGAFTGGVGATALSPVLGSMLFQVSDRDPVTLGAVVVLAVGGSLVAAYLPARRASRVDPIQVLKAE